MRQFTIASLERLLEIRAHTLRAWEYRYKLLKPERTSTNFRYYTVEDLRNLLNVTLLNRFGYKISLLAAMSPCNIQKAIDGLAGLEEKKLKELNTLIISMFSTDIEKFEMVLNNCVFNWGIDNTIEEIILPFLERTWLLSYNDTSSEVHFAVTAIRKKLILGIEKATPAQETNKRVLLFLPKNEHFDLVLLYLNYVVKGEGYKALYLGTNTSMENLEDIVICKRPDLICTYLTPNNKFNVHYAGQFLHQHLPQSLLIVTGFTDKFLAQAIAPNVKFLNHKQVREFLLYEFAGKTHSSF